MKWLKRIGLGLILIIFLAALGFVVWAETPLGPAPEALAALKSDSQVEVTDMENYIVFSPAQKQQEIYAGFIFYPGGRIDPRSYAVPLREIAAHGYDVYLLKVKLNLALFDINAAESIMETSSDLTWIVGGHSLGGVAAASFAGSHHRVAGLILLASYPASDSLRDSDLRVLSIYGTNDMAGPQKFLETSGLNPADAQYVVIGGGNHAQFGDYGPQPGDYEATITRADQQSQTVHAILAFLTQHFQ